MGKFSVKGAELLRRMSRILDGKNGGRRVGCQASDGCGIVKKFRCAGKILADKVFPGQQNDEIDTNKKFFSDKDELIYLCIGKANSPFIRLPFLFRL